MGSGCGKETEGDNLNTSENGATVNKSPSAPLQSPEISYSRKKASRSEVVKPANIAGDVLDISSKNDGIINKKDTVQPQTKAKILNPITMADESKSKRRAPVRTLSNIQETEYLALMKEHPEVTNLFKKLDSVKNMLKMKSGTIQEEESEQSAYLKDVLRKLNDFIVTKFEQFSAPGQRKLMGDYMETIGLGTVLVEFYCSLSTTNEVYAFTPSLLNEEGDDDDIQVLHQIRMILWNFSDSSRQFAIQVAERPLLNLLGADLLAMQGPSEIMHVKDDCFPFSSAVGIIHNCARANVSFDLYNLKIKTEQGEENEMHVLDVMSPFLKTKDTHTKLITLLTLAHIVNEEQNKILTADASLFDFLLEMIKKAFNDKHRRHLGFGVVELLDGFAHLSKNDNNKPIIMEKKAYPLLKDIIMKGNEEDQSAAVKVIWELAFMNKNKQLFREDGNFWKKVYSLQSSKNDDLAQAAQGACFVITNGDLDKYTPSGVKNFRKAQPKEKETEKKGKEDKKSHIMISYNWSDQKILLKVRDKLMKDGFLVWMDVDQMEGDILEAMGRAVENAHVVLICYSEKYKDSKNCRTEAQYAYQRNKEIIPLLMQRGYRPEGWLGALVGSKLFYEFTDKYPFEQKMETLHREIHNRLMIMNKAHTQAATKTVTSTENKNEEPAEKVMLLSWTKGDLTRWLKENKLEAFAGLKDLTAEQLAFLYKLFRRAPEFFYRCLEQKLGLKTLEELMRFTNALEKLSADYPDINQLLL